MLSGLCAEAMAAPIRTLRPVHIALDDAFTAPVIRTGSRFLAASAGEVDPDYDPTGARSLLATTRTSQSSTTSTNCASDADRASGSLGVPEPPPLALIVVGLELPRRLRPPAPDSQGKTSGAGADGVRMRALRQNGKRDRGFRRFPDQRQRAFIPATLRTIRSGRFRPASQEFSQSSSSCRSLRRHRSRDGAGRFAC